jgi:hypothetical protein
MIRRMCWLLAGAVLGIFGYRRLGKLARSVVPQRLAPAGRRRPAALGRSANAALGAGRGVGIGPAGFLRDVRDGMADYLNRHSGRSGNTLVGLRAGSAPQSSPGTRARNDLRAIPGSDNPKDGH